MEQHSFPERPRRNRHYDRSDAKNVDTVLFFLCPYRNLTTLTAAVLALHENIQVLNHGEKRLLRSGSLRFIKTPEPDLFDAFVCNALNMSTSGARGAFGGSIRLAHAIAGNEDFAAAFDRDADLLMAKKNPKCLTWKGSGTFQSLLWASNIDPVSLCATFKKIRFISPIRNPLDHIVSLQRSYRENEKIPGWLKPWMPNSDFVSVAKYILKSHHEIFRLRKIHPKHFFTFRKNPWVEAY